MNVSPFSESPSPNAPEPGPGACDELGARLAESVGRRVDTLAPESTVRLAPYSALRRRAEPARHTRRIAVAAVAGVVTVTAGIAVGTGVIGGEDSEIPFATATPEEQAAALVGRYAPTYVPDGLTLLRVSFETSEPPQMWVQVFAPETADLLHPGLLVQTEPPPPPGGDDFEVGQKLTVDGHPARLATYSDGALTLTVWRPDATIQLQTIDLTRDQLLEVAASAVVEPGRRGVTLAGLPTTWSSVLSAPATSRPNVSLYYAAEREAGSRRRPRGVVRVQRLSAPGPGRRAGRALGRDARTAGRLLQTWGRAFLGHRRRGGDHPQGLRPH